MTYLFTCMCRCIRRKNHETLEGKPSHLINILFMFFKFFKNFEKNFEKNLVFDGKIQVAYHYEDSWSN